jgi:hypothetical protein
MSPTEFDLRAALHDGDGDDNLNVDQLILGARAHAAQRRVRLLSTATIVLLVAGAGVGGTLVVRNDGGTNSTAGGAMVERHGANSDTGGKAGAPAPGALAPSGSADCPPSLPHYALPGGGSPGQFGADGRLFRKTVSSVVVCAYSTLLSTASKNTSYAAQLTLAGAQAKRLADSLENAPTTRAAQACGAARTNRYDYAIVGITSDGTRLPSVVASCALVTNGTAVRYSWTPPDDLQQLLFGTTPSTQPGSTTAASPTG